MSNTSSLWGKYGRTDAENCALFKIIKRQRQKRKQERQNRKAGRKAKR